MTRFDRGTGRLVMVDRGVLSAVEEGDDESLNDPPNWQKSEVEIARAMTEDAGERFIDPPDKFEFHEYRHMERFIGTVSNPDAADQLWRAIKGKGAFRHFKDTADRLDVPGSTIHLTHRKALRHLCLPWSDPEKARGT